MVDLNTQVDFCAPDGAYPAENLDTLLPALRRVIAWAKRNQAPVISSVDTHRAWELNHEACPPHCIDGTPGQRKLEFTLFSTRTRVETDNTLAVPFDLFRYHQQVIFPQRSDDLLANPKADRFITQLPVKEFILFGNGVEGAIKALSLGLIARGRSVTIVLDACGHWSMATAELALRQIAAKGARLITVDELRQRKLCRRHRYPRVPGNASGNGAAAPAPERVNGAPAGIPRVKLPGRAGKASIPLRSNSRTARKRSGGSMA